MGLAVLDNLDAAITAAESEAAEARNAAEELRGRLTDGGGDVPEVGTEDFKGLTDELSEHYRKADGLADRITDLKNQRIVVARSAGQPPEGEQSKGVTREELTELIGNASGKSVARQGIGSRVVEGEKFKALADAGVLDSANQMRNLDFGKGLSRTEFKDLITGGSDGAGPFKDPMRTPYQPLAQRPVRILELIQTIPTDRDSVKYARQLTAGHNVEIVKDPVTADAIGSDSGATGPSGEAIPWTAVDAGLKPESSYTFEDATAEIETLAHSLPIHKNQLSDVPQLESILNDEMQRGLYLFLESEVLGGNGSTGHLKGITSTTGVVSQPQGTDSLIVALHKALTGCRLKFEEPTVAVIHPNDWQTIRLMREVSPGWGPTGPTGASGEPGAPAADGGGFLFGPPSQAGDSTLWGLQVVVTPVVGQGHPVIGDFSGAQLYLREGVQILASDSHADFFTRNLIMLLAEMRAGFGVRRPGAFGKVA